VDIALIIHELLVEGGTERQCLSLARALALQGHKVAIYSSAYDRQNCYADVCSDLTIHVIGRGRLPWLKKPRFLRGYLDMVRLAAVVQERHEILNPHHWPAQWAAVWVKQRLGGNVVWMCNDVPNFHELARRQHGLWGLFRSAVYRAFYFFDRRQNSQVDLTLFLSRWAEGGFRPIYPGNTCVVRSGADPDRFYPGGNRDGIRLRFGYEPDDFVLLWLGIFMPHRRLQDAVEAISFARKRGLKVKLLLAGSSRTYPDYVNSLKTLVNDLGLEQEVCFAGKVADKEIRDFYCAADAFLFPNEQQTWGLSVLEAMACGCPVLVSEGAAVHEVLTDSQTAILFPPRNPAALAGRIEELVNNPTLRLSIASEGMRLARGQYNWQQFARSISEIFSQVAGGVAPHESDRPQELTTAR
jgi:glycosyltransferase involved in cell wall biosynthesis